MLLFHVRLGILLFNSSDIVKRELAKFYDKSADWIMSEGPKIIISIFILIFGIWFIKILRRRFDKSMNNKKVHSVLRPFFESLVFTALYIVLIFLIMQILGIRLTLFAAVIAAFGAAAGLALSGTLQNFASGVLILLLKPFNTGDNITAQGLEGTVSSIQIFYTIITTFDNRTVIMPNSKLSNEVIINITHQGNRRLNIELKLKHTVEYNKIKEILQKEFADLKEVCNEPPPRIGITLIDKEDYTVISNVWVNAHGFEDSRLIINERISNALHAAGVYN